MKTLIITGGTGALGTFVVERLSRTYACVLLGREELANEASARAAIPEHPYGLVHMAGGYTADASLDAWQQMLAVNATTAFVAVQGTLARMRRDAPGRIIAISSEATLVKQGSLAYTASKSALNALIEVTAAELAGTPITANALLPGTLDTAASRAAMPDARRVPLDTVADAIEFLLGDAAANITGALIPLRA